MNRPKNSLRIIAGQFKGRFVKTIEAPGTRPMTDRVRENLFNIIAPRLPETRFIDFFAGSGAVGIEALSRGAKHSHFVEMQQNWCDVIAENLTSLGVVSRGTVLKGSAYELVEKLNRQKVSFDIIFVGAPYDGIHHQKMADHLQAHRIDNEEGMIILQYRSKDPFVVPGGFEAETRTYGITALTFLYRAE